VNRAARRALVLIALAPGLTGCGGASLEGATAVAAGREPRPSTPGQILTPGECADARGAPARVKSRFWFVESSDHRNLVVEARPGFDSIVVSQRFELPTASVFQFYSDDGDGPRLLHELRFPNAAGAPPVLTVTDHFTERPLDDRTFAEARSALVTCQLTAPRDGGAAQPGSALR
jgi:hypothetical protein